MKIMAIDLGRARTGIAISDENAFLASPLCVLHEREIHKLAESIKNIVTENNVSEIVIGLPLNMDGSEGESAIYSREFAKILSEYVEQNIFLSDERGTTISAHKYLNNINTKSKKRKQIIDAVAATIILQDYLDFRRNTK